MLLDGGEDGLLARDQFAEIEQLLFDGADLDFVEVAGRLLAVASDEGDRGAFVEEFDWWQRGPSWGPGASGQCESEDREKETGVQA